MYFVDILQIKIYIQIVFLPMQLIQVDKDTSYNIIIIDNTFMFNY